MGCFGIREKSKGENLRLNVGKDVIGWRSQDSLSSFSTYVSAFNDPWLPDDVHPLPTTLVIHELGKVRVCDLMIPGSSAGMRMWCGTCSMIEKLR